MVICTDFDLCSVYGFVCKFEMDACSLKCVCDSESSHTLKSKYGLTSIVRYPDSIILLYLRFWVVLQNHPDECENIYRNIPGLFAPTPFLLLHIKVKYPRYRSGVAQRVGRGIALLFHDLGTRGG
jgi:hypothetical protein